MIKFFRKIRQKLIHQNKVQKYLVYAVGEIILVMIGILLAFQVNSWNDSRQEKQKEIKIVSLLLDDVKSEIYNLKIFVRKLKENQKNLIQLSKFIKERQRDSILYYVPKATSIWNYRPTIPTYNGLVQSNSLDIIKSDSIRTELVIHFDELYLYLDDLRENYKMSYKKFEESFEPYFVREYSEKLGFWNKKSIENVEQLLKDTRLKHRLGKFAGLSLGLAMRIDSLFMVENKKMQTSLDNYLKELND